MSNDLISTVENELPENTPENPEPTIFKVSAVDLQMHNNYVKTFPYNKKVKIPAIRPFVDKDLLNDSKDEYLYTERDPKGEQKITSNGHLLGGRKFLVTTFTLPGHGKKLYVLGADAAKVTGYRDGFIMFGRVKNLFKYSVGEDYRPFFIENGMKISKVKSRPIGLVTAKSLFTCFGSRVIQSGIRIKDDYWEEQIIEQGFTEEEQVFPVDKKSASSKPKIKRDINIKGQAALYVTPLPSLEDRMEYLKSQSTGHVTQVLPGQGISGGLELSSLPSIPKYTTSDSSGTVKHKNILSSLATNSNTSTTSSSNSSSNQLVIDDSRAGSRSGTGLPIYSRNVGHRLKTEDPEKLREIEYIHSAVETNFIMARARKPRNKTWQYYWQVKSGAPLGLVKAQEEEFKKNNHEILNVVEEERVYNDYLNIDQIITKRRKPNPNFLNYGNINGLKPPYSERPLPQNHLGFNPGI